MGVGEEAHELAAVQPPPAGAQPERGHERPARSGDHEERSRSASQMPPQSAAGASAMTRSSGIMLGTVAPGVAQGVSRPIACHPVRRYGVAPWRCISNGDRAKAEANRCKHKVTFDEAVSVFYDECLSLFIRNEMRQPASSVHDSPRRTSANGMKAKRSNEAAQMRAEYNFDYSKAERGVLQAPAGRGVERRGARSRRGQGISGFGISEQGTALRYQEPTFPPADADTRKVPRQLVRCARRRKSSWS